MATVFTERGPNTFAPLIHRFFPFSTARLERAAMAGRELAIWKFFENRVYAGDTQEADRGKFIFAGLEKVTAFFTLDPAGGKAH